MTESQVESFDSQYLLVDFVRDVVISHLLVEISEISQNGGDVRVAGSEGTFHTAEGRAVGREGEGVMMTTSIDLGDLMEGHGDVDVVSSSSSSPSPFGRVGIRRIVIARFVGLVALLLLLFASLPPRGEFVIGIVIVHTIPAVPPSPPHPDRRRGNTAGRLVRRRSGALPRDRMRRTRVERARTFRAGDTGRIDTENVGGDVVRRRRGSRHVVDDQDDVVLRQS
mmetsp:Transcript_39890/g.120067  ORF Transcript_39890/g.120067 Transcript_39890/m.120067 type:complete len:224 (+) Transcript_39890:478-1149(+)